jgi:hypothetical protein
MASPRHVLRYRRSGAELAGVVQRAHRLEAGLDLFQQRQVLGIQRTGLRHTAVKALVGKGQHAVGHAQRVGVVAAEAVGHVDKGAAALAELAAAEVQVFMVTMHKFRSP